MKTYSEIGSFFWIDRTKTVDYEGKNSFLPTITDQALTFSGRSAIDVALQDALQKREIKSAYVPSWCCDTMLQPFINHGISLQYYSVCQIEGKICCQIDLDQTCDVFLHMRYFGMEAEELTNAISSFKARGTIILEDITHSVFDEESFSVLSDYLVASLRKWFPIPAGGWIGKKSGLLDVKPCLDSNFAVIGKIQGMEKKRQYIIEKSGSPDEYLNLHIKFEEELSCFNGQYQMDTVSYRILSMENVERIQEQRRQNAVFLQQSLLDVEEITLPKMNLKKTTPLYYPIFLQPSDCDSLKKALILQKIYCPTHWPIIPGVFCDIPSQEISLICDQRYGLNDMQVISDCIHRWAKER